MLLLFSLRVAERSPVWERAVHSVSVRVLILCVCFFPFVFCIIII